ncbi:PAS domain-containing protein [Bradyrhizobium sp.]|uniref:PAS domain-containing protein n=1 Tax=Bradyrhizobium sp. TaxID=376 RepID=UPI0025C32EDC|nr:PAS domain-containing protein [Bradyrhizobium sp.]
MKHPSSRGFYAYWDAKRGDALAPDRSEIEPGAVRELLGDIFVLSYDNEAGYPFRVAGTRVSALLGRDLKDASFSALFAPDGRREIENIISYVAEETLPAIAGITAATKDGGVAHLELLLLPFVNRAHAPISLTGVLAPFESDRGTLGDFKVTSWRYLHRPQKLLPRALRKLAVARGFMVYEGLR